MSKTFPFCSQVERHLLTHGGSKPWKIKKIFAGFLKVSLGSSSSLKYRGVRMPPQVATEASSQLQTELKSRKPLRFPSNRSMQAGYHHPAEGSMCLGEKKKKSCHLGLLQQVESSVVLTGTQFFQKLMILWGTPLDALKSILWSISKFSGEFLLYSLGPLFKIIQYIFASKCIWFSLHFLGLDPGTRWQFTSAWVCHFFLCIAPSERGKIALLTKWFPKLV